MKQIILIASFLFLAGAMNGWMDALQFHGAWQSFDNTSFWNPATSWGNKWARSTEGVLLVGTERFWGSSRWFVALTDGWHLIKFIWLTCITLAVVIAAQYDILFTFKKWKKMALLVGLFLLIRLVMSAGFYVTYSIIF